MQIEIIDAYLRTIRGKKSWSIHALLPELGLHIRGIKAKKSGNKWFLMLPHTFGNHQETGAEIRFPVITFADLALNQEFKKLLKHKAMLFLEKKIFDLQLKKEEDEQKKPRHLKRIKPKFNKLPTQN